MALSSTCKCLVYLLALNIRHLAQAEVFTAVSDIERLLQTHRRVIGDVGDYIVLEQERLETLKKRVDLYREEHDKAIQDVPNYLGNPINAFTLIKRLTTDLESLRNIAQTGAENIKKIITNHEDMKYPSSEDLTGAAQALTRLQETYKLNVSDLSEGNLNGVVYSAPMTAGDCYELGLVLYKDGDYKDALPWLLEAQRKFPEDNEFHHFSATDILEYISATHFYLGEIETALELAKQLLAADRKHPRAPANIMLYQKAIAEREAQAIIKQLSEEGDDTSAETPTSEEINQYDKVRKNYEILCRGEMEVHRALAKKLKCRYLTENHPFLKLAPIKMEYVYHNPDIMIFHDVMNDDEIKFIQEKAKPRFGRALVQDSVTGELVPVKYRISKSAWLRDEESAVIARVSQRVADMTGLSMDTAEELQVVNYGIGGHYEPHYDFTRKHESQKNYQGIGNRIGTVLFYMSDVAQGGATVFTELGLSLFPIKGAAAFWYNLHPSGEGDLATRHAACPVLRGSKWVSNKWIHMVGQEFRRPCNLEYQDETIVHKIPKPIRKILR